ncbi:MAG: methylmalonyl-CoA mutase [Deltaproteobacteria bacterium]|nr:methylmalonyl-CoA mutase [Deltaproteobacteria bacterium]
MSGQDDLAIEKALEGEWARIYEEVYVKKRCFNLPEQKSESGIPLKSFYGPRDTAEIPFEDIGAPGCYPYTRGIYPLSYQYQPWMTQQIHGFGLPEDTEAREKLLEKEGMTGFGGARVAFIEPDVATCYAFDPDDPAAKGMVGNCGASYATEEDIDILCRSYDLSRDRIGFSTKVSCLPLLAVYLVYAEKRGYKPHDLNGQSQNRRKITWLGQNSRDHQPREQLKLQVELIKYCVENMPRWNHTNLCGYIAGENCATPAQEMAWLLSEAVELVESCIEAGLDPEAVIPRFSAQMHLGMDFFEEIAKLRAFRRLWAKTMKERFGVKKASSQQFRIHVHMGGMNLTAQQPLNNIARTTLQALAAVLGGTQSIHTTSYDEAISLPSEEAVTTALRVNQVILHESGTAKVSDPLAGSYYMEWLTTELEKKARELVEEVETKGGCTKCMENGWWWELFDRQIRQYRRDIDEGKKIMVGVNKFQKEETLAVSAFSIDQEKAEKTAVERIKKWKENREHKKVTEALKNIERAAKNFESAAQAGLLMPTLIQAARDRCTIGEMTKVLFDVYGVAYPY